MYSGKILVAVFAIPYVYYPKLCLSSNLYSVTIFKNCITLNADKNFVNVP